MFIIGNFFIAVAQIMDIVLFWMYWLILIRALISWVNPDPYNPIVQFIHRATEPILFPIRRFMPSMAIDISPIIAFFLIIFLQSFLVASLRDLGYHMRQSRESGIIQEFQVEPRVKEESPIQQDQLVY
ncbi:MAG: YggT family protein [Candidatus Omnitrophica bacterium]|nr:YggT family protein [Candidatus Omnitrophota bacterium]